MPSIFSTLMVTAGLPLVERKALLEPLIAGKLGSTSIKTAATRSRPQACPQLGFDGVVIDAPYAPENREPALTLPVTTPVRATLRSGSSLRGRPGLA
jgi:hypothetical protein